MKRVGMLCASLLVAGSGQLQGQESRGTALRLPPTRSPWLADAAMRQDAATVRALLGKGADVNLPQGDGMTALHWAARHGDLALTTALVRAHASTKAVTRIGAYTPLHVASEVGSAPVV